MGQKKIYNENQNGKNIPYSGSYFFEGGYMERLVYWVKRIFENKKVCKSCCIVCKYMKHVRVTSYYKNGAWSCININNGAINNG